MPSTVLAPKFVDAEPLDTYASSSAATVTVVVPESAGCVVNDHTRSLTSALPATSLTPLAPPRIVAVKNPPAARSDEGFSVPRCAAASYVPVAGTAAPPAPARNTVEFE